LTPPQLKFDKSSPDKEVHRGGVFVYFVVFDSDTTNCSIIRQSVLCHLRYDTIAEFNVDSLKN